MQEPEARRAVAAARSAVSALGLAVDDAIPLSNSNRLAVRLLPCDVVARVTSSAALTPAAARATWLSGDGYRARLVSEVQIVRRLAEYGSPVAGPDPRVDARVHWQDGFAVTVWRYFEPVRRMPRPAEYAAALARLHTDLRRLDLATPRFTDRLAATEHDVRSREATPGLADSDRSFLAGTLRELREAVLARGAAEQILHGEPHPGNVLNTSSAPYFIDFEDVVRGPVEFDLAWAPDEVGRNYRGVDQDLLDDCRRLVLAIIATHRWSRGDEHPGGRRAGVRYLDALRVGAGGDR